MGFKEWLIAQEAIIGSIPKASTAIRGATRGMVAPAAPAKPAAPKQMFSQTSPFKTPRQPSGVVFGR